MNRIEIQRKLYDARNAYLKAKSETDFWRIEIASLKACEKLLDKPTDSLFNELFGDISNSYSSEAK
jgi:hypothetical protein